MSNNAQRNCYCGGCGESCERQIIKNDEPDQQLMNQPIDFTVSKSILRPAEIEAIVNATNSTTNPVREEDFIHPDVEMVEVRRLKDDTLTTASYTTRKPPTHVARSHFQHPAPPIRNSEPIESYQAQPERPPTRLMQVSRQSRSKQPPDADPNNRKLTWAINDRGKNANDKSEDVLWWEKRPVPLYYVPSKQPGNYGKKKPEDWPGWNQGPPIGVAESINVANKPFIDDEVHIKAPNQPYTAWWEGKDTKGARHTVRRDAYGDIWRFARPTKDEHRSGLNSKERKVVRYSGDDYYGVKPEDLESD